jgi:hypothetical protein
MYCGIELSSFPCWGLSAAITNEDANNRQVRDFFGNKFSTKLKQEMLGGGCTHQDLSIADWAAGGTPSPSKLGKGNKYVD